VSFSEQKDCQCALGDGTCLIVWFIKLCHLSWKSQDLVVKTVTYDHNSSV
jgi:hypothetical protein